MTWPILPGAEPRFYPGGPTGCLCLHGLTASPHEVAWLAADLAGRGCTVLAPRLAGHGTDPGDLARTRWRDWYASALDGWQLLRAQCDRVVVCGLSMGALLALRLAADQPVAGVAALAAPFVLRRPLTLPVVAALKWIRPYTDQTDRTDFPERLRQEQARRGEPVLGRVRYSRWPTRAVEELLRLTAEVEASLPQVTAPVLAIYSQGDQTVAPASLDSLRRGLRRAPLETLLLQHSDHILTQDAERQTVFDRLAAFIGAHGAPQF